MHALRIFGCLLVIGVWISLSVLVVPRGCLAGENCETMCGNIKAARNTSPKSISCAKLCRNFELNIVQTASTLCQKSITRGSDYELCTELVLDLLLR